MKTIRASLALLFASAVLAFAAPKSAIVAGEFQIAVPAGRVLTVTSFFHQEGTANRVSATVGKDGFSMLVLQTRSVIEEEGSTTPDKSFKVTGPAVFTVHATPSLRAFINYEIGLR